MKPAYCTAQFKGWIPQPGEVTALPKSLAIDVELVQVRVGEYEARMKGAKKSFIPGSGLYTLIQRQVAGRFDEQTSPWTWWTFAFDQKFPTTAPDCELFHQAAYPPDHPRAEETICSKLVPRKRLAGGKQPVTCPDCRDKARTGTTPGEWKTAEARGKLFAAPDLMHCRSTEGSQIGNVETLCGLTVHEKHTELLHRVVRNQGKRVTCLKCDLAAEAIAEHSASAHPNPAA